MMRLVLYSSVTSNSIRETFNNYYFHSVSKIKYTNLVKDWIMTDVLAEDYISEDDLLVRYFSIYFDPSWQRCSNPS